VGEVDLAKEEMNPFLVSFFFKRIIVACSLVLSFFLTKNRTLYCS
jgi:hypothetical protein